METSDTRAQAAQTPAVADSSLPSTGTDSPDATDLSASAKSRATSNLPVAANQPATTTPLAAAKPPATVNPPVTTSLSATNLAASAHERAVRRAEAISRRLAKSEAKAVKEQSESPTIHKYQEILLGSQPTLTAKEVVAQVGATLEEFNRYWLAMGFPLVDPERVLFTETDVEAFRYWTQMRRTEGLRSGTVMSLIRAQSHLADRLTGWQSEALVEDAQKRFGLDDSSARLVMVDTFEEYLDDLEKQLNYAWRRQLLSLLDRTVKESVDAAAKDKRKRFPLTRGVGFVDMVSYTSTSAVLGEELVGLIERFEYLCRSVVAAQGGRVVKMIGDAVMFNAENLASAVNVVVALIDELGKAEGILPVRASLVWGDVFSRSGDIFGPPVNLAARLVDVAPTGEILVDAPTAAAIAGSELGDTYSVTEFPSTKLRGLGMVSPYLLAPRPENRDNWHAPTDT